MILGNSTINKLEQFRTQYEKQNNSVPHDYVHRYSW